MRLRLLPQKRFSSPVNELLSQEGFTLVEVLIAVVILAVGLLLVVESLSRGQQELRASDYLTQASMLAEDKLAETEIRVRQYHRLQAGQEQGVWSQFGKNIPWLVKVEAYHHESVIDETKLNKVTVDLNWMEGSSRRAGLLLESLLINRDKKE